MLAWKPVNDEIAELWKGYPEGTSQLVLQALEKPRETHLLSRGNVLQPAEVVQPDVRAQDGGQRADHGALDRESDLAVLFRNREHGRKSRHAGRNAVTPRAAPGSRSN